MLFSIASTKYTNFLMKNRALTGRQCGFATFKTFAGKGIFPEIRKFVSQRANRKRINSSGSSPWYELCFYYNVFGGVIKGAVVYPF